MYARRSLRYALRYWTTNGSPPGSFRREKTINERRNLMTDTQTIPLNKLVLCERNVRKTGAEDDLARLIASIEAHGRADNTSARCSGSQPGSPAMCRAPQSRGYAPPCGPALLVTQCQRRKQICSTYSHRATSRLYTSRAKDANKCRKIPWTNPPPQKGMDLMRAGTCNELMWHLLITLKRIHCRRFAMPVRRQSSHEYLQGDRTFCCALVSRCSAGRLDC